MNLCGLFDAKAILVEEQHLCRLFYAKDIFVKEQ